MDFNKKINPLWDICQAAPLFRHFWLLAVMGGCPISTKASAAAAIGAEGGMGQVLRVPLWPENWHDGDIIIIYISYVYICVYVCIYILVFAWFWKNPRWEPIGPATSLMRCWLVISVSNNWVAPQDPIGLVAWRSRKWFLGEDQNLPFVTPENLQDLIFQWLKTFKNPWIPDFEC